MAVAYRNILVAAALAMVMLLVAACESKRIGLVAETDDEGADFGRTALANAIVKLSERPQDASAYAAFAARIEEIRPVFNREVARQAELRLSVLAVAPLRAGLSQSHEEQMQQFATAVWPSVLQFPVEPGETVASYVLRLCSSKLALTCNNVVPEYWPVILNAQVWRTLKSRVDVAYDRCQWCEDDPSFRGIMDSIRDAHLRLEEAAQVAQEEGQPRDWPKAGRHASELSSDLIVTFGADGLVRVRGENVEGGNWRQTIADARASEDLVALHFRPERMVSELLRVLGDLKAAGFQRVALVVRENSFPYQPKQYELRAQKKSYLDLGVHDSDSIQVLVQSLDLRAANAGVTDSSPAP